MSFRPTGTPPKSNGAVGKKVIVEFEKPILFGSDYTTEKIASKEQLEKEKLYKDLAEFHGEQHQCLVCIEEMAELTKELVKYERGHEDEDQYKKIAEEIADVEIMLEQVARIYDVEADVDKWKDEKLKRTRARLDLLIK